MNADPSSVAKDVLQAIGVLALIGLFAMIFHKAFGDLAALSQQYSGGEFWLRLGRYVIANLAGG